MPIGIDEYPLPAEMQLPDAVHYAATDDPLKDKEEIDAKKEMSLKKFFNSEDSNDYQKRIDDALNIIKQYMAANNIKSDYLDTFIKVYWDSNDTSSKTALRNFELYTEGLPTLWRIAQCIKNNDIQSDSQKDAIANLLGPEIAVCGPGTCTNITNCFTSLVADNDISIKIKADRRKIAEQLALDTISNFPYHKKDIKKPPTGMEIHVVNVLLNMHADELGIDKQDDYFTRHINPDVISALSNHFATKIESNIRTLIDTNLQNLPMNELEGKYNLESISAFTSALDKYGDGNQFYKDINDIITMDENSNIQVSWKAPYLLRLSLLERLTNNNLINKNEANIDSLIYKHMTYTDQEFNEKISSPLIPCFIEAFAEGKPHREDAKKEMMKQLKNGGDAYRKELIEGLSLYRDSKEYQSLTNEQREILWQEFNSVIGIDVKKCCGDLSSESTRDMLIEYLKLYDKCNDKPFDRKALIDEYLQSKEPNAMLAVATLLDIRLTESDIENKATLTALLARHNKGEYILARNNYFPDEMSTPDRRNARPLHYAIIAGSAAAVDIILSKKVNVNFSDREINSPLHYAVLTGNNTILEKLLKSENILLNVQNRNEFTPLMLAAREGKLEAVKTLISHEDIDVNFTNNVGESALIIAARYGRTEIVTELIKQQYLDINHKEQHGSTALMLAAENGHAEIVETLISRDDIDINRKTNNGFTALMLAAENGHTQVVETLIGRNDIDINITLNNGFTALMLAVENGHTEVVKTLIKNEKTYVNQTNTSGVTALMVAAHNGYTEIVETLISRDDIDINRKTNDGFTALMLAARNGHAEVVNKLIANLKINVHQTNTSGVSALMVAAQHGHTEIVKTLISHGDIEINKFAKDGYTALMHAARNGHTQVVETLIGHNDIDINITVNNGFTALMLAAEKGHTEVVKTLINNKKTDVNQTNTSGVTALMVAAQNGHTEIVETLIDCDGIDINKTLKDGSTALMYAAKKGHTQIVELFLNKSQANDTQKRKQMISALELAALNGHSETINSLLSLSYKSNDNIKDALIIFKHLMDIENHFKGNDKKDYKDNHKKNNDEILGKHLIALSYNKHVSTQDLRTIRSLLGKVSKQLPNDSDIKKDIDMTLANWNNNHQPSGHLSKLTRFKDNKQNERARNESQQTSSASPRKKPG